MRKAYIYMITRTDGLKYIGITLHPKRRLREHLKTKRFESGIASMEILHENNSYEDCEKMEEYYINEYDSYKNGLNTTSHSKGKLNNAACLTKYNTLGYKYSDASKKKMSDAKKGMYLGENNPNFGRQYLPEELEKMSKTKKGKIWITDGVNTKLHDPLLEIPEGWERGKTQNIDKENIRQKRLGTISITNGKECFSIKKEDFPEWQAKGYERGMITKNLKIMKNGEMKKVSLFDLQSHLDDGWIRHSKRDRTNETEKEGIP
jgi:predicted GIY-YIG superfamily endonuclease